MKCIGGYARLLDVAETKLRQMTLKNALENVFVAEKSERLILKELMEIKIKYFTDKIEKLCYIDGKSDWIDLRCAEDIHLSAGEFKLIPLGMAIALPQGYEAHIVPRSSTFKNWGILQSNSCGIVDESYSGDNDQWMMPVYATRDTDIHVNDRICQFRIFEHQPAFSFKEVEHLDGPDRGGFGSTGLN